MRLWIWAAVGLGASVNGKPPVSKTGTAGSIPAAPADWVPKRVFRDVEQYKEVLFGSARGDAEGDMVQP